MAEVEVTDVFGKLVNVDLKDSHSGVPSLGVVIGRWQMSYGEDIWLVADEKSHGMPVNKCWCEVIGEDLELAKRLRDRYVDQYGDIAQADLAAVSNFRQEDRYVVLKRTDIAKLDATDRELLDNLCDKIKLIRLKRGKPPATGINMLVVEDDWRIYESVWSLVEMEHDWNKEQATATRADVEAQ